MEQLFVTGMSCVVCQARIEKAVGKVPGATPHTEETEEKTHETVTRRSGSQTDERKGF